MCVCVCGVCGGGGSAVYIVIIHCSEMLVWCQYAYEQIISGLFLLRTACLMLNNRLDPKSLYEAPLEWWLTCAHAGRVAAPLNMDVEIKNKQTVSRHTHLPVDLITLHVLIFPYLFFSFVWGRLSPRSSVLITTIMGNMSGLIKPESFFKMLLSLK